MIYLPIYRIDISKENRMVYFSWYIMHSDCTCTCRSTMSGYEPLAPRLLERCCAEYVKTSGDLLLINHSQSLDIISCVSLIGQPCLNRQNTMDQRWPNDKQTSTTLAQYGAIVVISCFLGNIRKNHFDKSIRYL